MTRYDIIKSMTPSEMAEWLCILMSEGERRVNIDSCKMCPVNHLCRPRHNGWRDYLAKEPYSEKGIFKELDDSIEGFFDYCDEVISRVKGGKQCENSNQTRSNAEYQ